MELWSIGKTSDLHPEGTEFDSRRGKSVFVSATPGDWELENTDGEIVQQVIRPTGLLDPTVEIKPTEGQIDDLLHLLEHLLAPPGDRHVEGVVAAGALRLGVPALQRLEQRLAGAGQAEIHHHARVFEDAALLWVLQQHRRLNTG